MKRLLIKEFLITSLKNRAKKVTLFIRGNLFNGDKGEFYSMM